MEEISVASPEAVDAYKTYLFRQGVPHIANSIKPGDLIPVAFIENHIKVMSETIETYKKWGTSYDAEINTLAGLKKLYMSVSGKRTPTKAELFLSKTQALAAQQKALNALDALKAAAKADANTLKGVEDAKKLAANKLIEKYEGNADPQQLMVEIYEKKLIAKLKAQTQLKPLLLMKPGTMIPVSKSSSIATLNVGRSQLEQEFIMRIGMVSNLNVLIEQVSQNGIARNTVRLRCKQCASLRVLEDAMFLSGATELTDDVEKFCKQHRHEAAKPVAEPEVVGRRFREDD